MKAFFFAGLLCAIMVMDVTDHVISATPADKPESFLPEDNLSVTDRDYEPERPRIAIAGLGIESSTFSPALTTEEAFRAKYGSDVFSSYPFLSANSPLRLAANWIPTLVGKSLPGGAVTRKTYEITG